MIVSNNSQDSPATVDKSTGSPFDMLWAKSIVWTYKIVIIVPCPLVFPQKIIPFLHLHIVQTIAAQATLYKKEIKQAIHLDDFITDFAPKH